MARRDAGLTTELDEVEQRSWRGARSPAEERRGPHVLRDRQGGKRTGGLGGPRGGPSGGRTSPLIKLNSVVLPAPFGPIRATISPSPTPKLTPLRTRRPPKRLPTSVPSRRIGPMGSPFRSQGEGGCQRTHPCRRLRPWVDVA